jgi:hypothetical protein
MARIARERYGVCSAAIDDDDDEPSAPLVGERPPRAPAAAVKQTRAPP